VASNLLNFYRRIAIQIKICAKLRLDICEQIHSYNGLLESVAKRPFSVNPAFKATSLMYFKLLIR